MLKAKKINNLNEAQEFYDNLRKGKLNIEAARDAYVLGIGDKGLLNPSPQVEPNILLSGAMGTGKSVGLRQIIASWLKANSDQALVILFDPFKGAKDYVDAFEGVKNILISERDFDVSEPITALERILSQLMGELRARQNLLQSHKCISLDQYEEQTKTRLARILFVMEEFSSIPYQLLDWDKNIGIAESGAHNLRQLLRLGRNYGITIAASAQKATEDDIPPSLVANFSHRLVGKTSKKESMYLVGRDEAGDLTTDSKGIFVTEEGRATIPYFSSEEIKSLMSDVPPLTATILTFDYTGSFLPKAGQHEHTLEIKRAIVKALMEFKVKRGLKAKDLATLMDTDPTSVSFMGAGEVNRFTLDYLLKCAEKLDDDELNKGLKRMALAF